MYNKNQTDDRWATYRFPNMKAMINQMKGHCLDCNVTTKDRRQEQTKPSVISKDPWEQTSMHFGGPYPDGHYNFVPIKQRTRYLEVGTVYSTGIIPTWEKLRKLRKCARIMVHHSSLRSFQTSPKRKDQSQPYRHPRARRKGLYSLSKRQHRLPTSKKGLVLKGTKQFMIC